jgi:hypothetical protein
MTRVTTFTQSPDTILPADLNNIQDDYEELYQEYHMVHVGTMGDIQSLDPTLVYLLAPAETKFLAQPPNSFTIGQTGQIIFYWNANELFDMAAGRSIKLRLRSTIACNGASAPGVTYTVVVRRQGGYDGTPVSKISAVWASTGNTALLNTHTTPSANTITLQTSEITDATTLTADVYAIALLASGTPNGASDCYVWTDVSYAFA